MTQISQYRTPINDPDDAYKVNNIIIYQGKLYRFGTNKDFPTNVTAKVNNYANVTRFSQKAVQVLRPNTTDRYLFLRTANNIGVLPDPSGYWDLNLKITVQTYWDLITDGVNNGAPDQRYWETLGTFDDKDIQHLNNTITDAKISTANLEHLLLILSPEKYSATIFERLKGLINSIKNVNVRNRLLGFIEFQMKGFVNRDDNGTKRSLSLIHI